MMYMISQYDPDGRYTFVGTWSGDPPGKGVGVHYGVADPHTQYHDTALDKPVDMPPRPSDFHAFDYATKTWVPQPEQAWAMVRYQRDTLLSKCDWVVTKSAEIGAAVPASWAAYRQALRDVPLQSDPFNITWPSAPV